MRSCYLYPHHMLAPYLRLFSIPAPNAASGAPVPYTRTTCCRPMRLPALLCVGFTLWVLFVAAVISPYPNWSYHEIAGQWFMAMAALIIGLALALQEERAVTYSALIVLIGVLVTQIIAVDIQGFWIIWKTAALPHMARLGGFTAGPGKASYLTNFLLAALTAETSLRMEGNRRWRIPKSGLIGLAFLCLLSLYFETKRLEYFNALVFPAFLAFIALRNPMVQFSRRSIFWAVVGAVGLLGLIVADLIFDPRWGTLWATIPIALDTAHHMTWLNAQLYPYPHLPNGQVVSASNYLRVAWIKEGLITLWHHPLGVGYGRGAFAHALTLRFGKLANAIEPNNSILNMAVGAGIPGALLWVGEFVSLGRVAALRLRGASAFESRFLLLIVLAFGLRMFVDNDMQNYTLEQVCFFVGFLLPLATLGTPDLSAI